MAAAAKATVRSFDLFDEEKARRRLIASLAKRQPRPLSESETAPGGPGIYLLYYSGPRRHLYGEIADSSWPLYVGKASHGLRERLQEHRKSILNAGGLDERQLTVKLIPLRRSQCAAAEEILIDHFRPLWNQVVPGFGSKGTSARGPSPWDQLHPGRPGRSGPDSSPGRELRSRVRSYISATSMGCSTAPT